MEPRTHKIQVVEGGSETNSETILSIDKSSFLWQLIESSTDGLGILDHSFRLTACNKSFANSLGYSVDEMVGKYAWDWDACYNSQKEFLDALSSNGLLPENFETRHRTKNGNILDIDISITSTVIDGQGVYMFVSKDITLQKKEKRSLLQTHFAMDNASENCIWYDAQGTIIYANNSACKSLEYLTDELIGKTVYDINPEFDKERFDNFINILEKRGELLFESTHITRSKERYPVEISANYFKDGNNFYICAFNRDITNRKLAEKELKEHSQTLEEIIWIRTAELRDEIERKKQYEIALQESEVTFKALAENSLDIIMRFDRNYKHLYVNPAVHSVTSYTPEQLIGKSFSELKRAKSLAPFLNSALEKVFSTAKSHQIEFMLPNGIWIESLLAPEVDPDGTVKAVVSTSRNISTHKETLQKLNMYNQLQFLLTDLASTFINLPLQETQSAIDEALGKIAEFLKADKAFIFYYDYDSNTCKKKYSYSTQKHKNLSQRPDAGLFEYLCNKKDTQIIHITDASNMPPEHEMFDFVQNSGLKSMVFVPMYSGRQLYGGVVFQSYDTPHKYSEQEQQLLSVFSQLLVSIDKRNETDRALRAQHAYQEIVASIAVRFVAANENNFDELITTTLNQLVRFFKFDRAAFYHNDLFQPDTIQRLESVNDSNGTVINNRPTPIPSVIQKSLQKNSSIFKNQTIFHFPDTRKIDKRYHIWQDHLDNNGIQSAIYLSCKTDQQVYGILGFEMTINQVKWSQPQINGLVIIAQIFGYTLASLETRKALLDAKDTLEIRVSDRTHELQQQIQEKEKAMEDLAKAQSSLLETSRSAGMAEVATNVLHNVGNVLNSINVACNILISHLEESRLSNLTKITEMLKDCNSNYAEFLTIDEKGKHIPDYLVSLAPQLEKEQQTLFDEVLLLMDKVDHVKKIISMQQRYGKVQSVLEPFSPQDLFDDALSLSTSVLSKYDVSINKQYDKVPQIVTDRHKVLQILLNLITNAGNAFEGEPASGNNLVTLALTVNNNNHVRFMVTDNGKGIKKEYLSKIFQHGFTTRTQGHGFGLHSGALAAWQLGGTLTVQSNGVGCGATFILELPVQHVGTTL